jgi:uncharacterized protein
LIENDAVQEWVLQHPDRFAGLAAVDLARPMTAVRELRRCVDEFGFKGLRVVPWMWEAPPTDRRYYRLYATCIDLGVPLFTQVGHTGPLRLSETGRPIPYIDQVALDFPELVIIAGYIGYPWTEEMIAVARKHENVYIDTSAYTARRYPTELVRFMQSTSGRRKVMFGTNYPMTLPDQALQDLEALGLDEETRELFLAGSAQRLLAIAQQAATRSPACLLLGSRVTSATGWSIAGALKRASRGRLWLWAYPAAFRHKRRGPREDAQPAHPADDLLRVRWLRTLLGRRRPAPASRAPRAIAAGGGLAIARATVLPHPLRPRGWR